MYTVVVLYIWCMQFIKYCSEFDSRNSWTTGPKRLIVLKLRKRDQNNGIIKYIHVLLHGWRRKLHKEIGRIIIIVLYRLLQFCVINFGFLYLLVGRQVGSILMTFQILYSYKDFPTYLYELNIKRFHSIFLHVCRFF